MNPALEYFIGDVFLPIPGFLLGKNTSRKQAERQYEGKYLLHDFSNLETYYLTGINLESDPSSVGQDENQQDLVLDWEFDLHIQGRLRFHGRQALSYAVEYLNSFYQDISWVQDVQPAFLHETVQSECLPCLIGKLLDIESDFFGEIAGVVIAESSHGPSIGARCQSHKCGIGIHR